MAYATESDLENWLGASGRPLPPDPQTLLQRASSEIDMATFSCIYDRDPVTFAPTNSTDIATLRDATCAQVEWWLATGDQLGEMEGVNRYQVEGVLIMRPDGLRSTAPRAKKILQLGGLLPGYTYAR